MGDVRAENAVLVLADLQHGIIEASGTLDRAQLGRGVRAACRLAKICGMPVIVTCVPPQDGAAPVLMKEITDELGPQTPLIRTTTDSFDNPAIVAALEATGRKTLVMCGVATEVAVKRPALSGVARGYEVHVVVDACGGFSARSEDAVFRRLVAAGVTLTSVPALAGELAADFSQPQAQAVVGVLMDFAGA